MVFTSRDVCLDWHFWKFSSSIDGLPWMKNSCDTIQSNLPLATTSNVKTMVVAFENWTTGVYSAKRSWERIYYMRFLIYDFYYIKNPNRWTIRATEWTPRDWTRIRGCPKTRWRDDLTRQIGPLWLRLAKHRHLCDQSMEGFLCQEWIQTLIMMMKMINMKFHVITKRSLYDLISVVRTANIEIKTCE